MRTRAFTTITLLAILAFSLSRLVTAQTKTTFAVAKIDESPAVAPASQNVALVGQIGGVAWDVAVQG